MAFTLPNWVRVSTSANEPITALQDGSYIGGPRLYSYWSQLDTQATIAASGYFNEGVANQGVARDLATGDIIIAESPTDGTVVFYIVTNTDGVITVSAFGTGTIGTANIEDGAVTLPKLAAAVAPSDVVKFGAQLTSVGGAAVEAFTVTGALATDLAFLQMVDNGTNNVTILQAVVTSNTLTVTFSADPGADAIFNYQLTRATA